MIFEEQFYHLRHIFNHIQPGSPNVEKEIRQRDVSLLMGRDLDSASFFRELKSGHTTSLFFANIFRDLAFFEHLTQTFVCYYKETESIPRTWRQVFYRSANVVLVKEREYVGALNLLKNTKKETIGRLLKMFGCLPR